MLNSNPLKMFVTLSHHPFHQTNHCPDSDYPDHKPEYPPDHHPYCHPNSNSKSQHHLHPDCYPEHYLDHHPVCHHPDQVLMMPEIC